MNAAQEANVKAVVAMIWSPSVANNLNYNEAVVDVVNESLEKIQKCSALISGVLLGVSVGLVGAAAVMFSREWLYTVGAAVAGEFASIQLGIGQMACVNTVAASMRSPLEMASAGI